MLTSISRLLGTAATAYGVLAALSVLLQARQTRASGNSCEVSARFFASYAGGYAIWLLYGLSAGNGPLIVVDAVGLLCAGLTLAVALSLRGSLAHPASCTAAPASREARIPRQRHPAGRACPPFSGRRHRAGRRGAHRCSPCSAALFGGGAGQHPFRRARRWRSRRRPAQVAGSRAPAGRQGRLDPQQPLGAPGRPRRLAACRARPGARRPWARACREHAAHAASGGRSPERHGKIWPRISRGHVRTTTDRAVLDDSSE